MLFIVFVVGYVGFLLACLLVSLTGGFILLPLVPGAGLGITSIQEVRWVLLGASASPEAEEGLTHQLLVMSTSLCGKKGRDLLLVSSGFLERSAKAFGDQSDLRYPCQDSLSLILLSLPSALLSLSSPTSGLALSRGEVRFLSTTALTCHHPGKMSALSLYTLCTFDFHVSICINLHGHVHPGSGSLTTSGICCIFLCAQSHFFFPSGLQFSRSRKSLYLMVSKGHLGFWGLGVGKMVFLGRGILRKR
jgi:hypothetical protein